MSAHQREEGSNVGDEQLGLLERPEVPTAVDSFQYRMSVKRLATQRRDGRMISAGRIEHPVGTVTRSLVPPPNTSWTWRMLSP